MDSSLSLVNVNKQNRPRIIDMSTLDDRNFGNIILIADRRKKESIFMIFYLINTLEMQGQGMNQVLFHL